MHADLSTGFKQQNMRARAREVEWRRQDESADTSEAVAHKQTCPVDVNVIGIVLTGAHD